jgi:hypothetical protein
MKITKRQAEAIWDILITDGGVNGNATYIELDKSFFVGYVTGDNNFEYRFQGKFGFGGKLHAGGPHRPPIVTQYAENETEQSKAEIDAINEKIAALF